MTYLDKTKILASGEIAMSAKNRISARGKTPCDSGQQIMSAL